MTKHVPDEALSKMPVSLDDAGELVSANLKVLNTQPLGICSSPRVRTLHKIEVEAPLIKPRATRAKMEAVRNRLERIMHKLYDLEPDSKPEKSLNVDLGVDLYQMENL